MKSNPSPNYDLVAPFYRSISRLVFGDRIHKATSIFLDRIPEKGEVLIVGGGDGDILKELFLKRPEIIITYVDISKKMLDLAKKKNPYPLWQIRFENDESYIHADSRFDAVLTAFFLDQMTEEQVMDFSSIFEGKLKDDGKWLVTDFMRTNKTGHKILIRIMYLFFFLFAGLKQQRLVDLWSLIEDSGWAVNDEWASPSGLIGSKVFVKS